jgi:hypothetical protein
VRGEEERRRGEGGDDGWGQRARKRGEGARLGLADGRRGVADGAGWADVERSRPMEVGGRPMWMADELLGRGGRRERRAVRREKRGGMGFWLLFLNLLLFSFSS